MSLVLLVLGCAETTPSADRADLTEACTVNGERPSSWTEETNGKVDPAYTSVFDRTMIHSLSLTVATEDYEASYAELTDLIGEFGSGGGGGGGGGGPAQPSAEELAAMTEACSGKAAGDSCSGTVGGEAFTGSCAQMGPQLICMPAMGGDGGGGGGGVDLIGADPSYFPVTVQDDDHTWCSVGMRWKGNATLSQSWTGGIGKLPFRLNFDRYEDEVVAVDDQRYYGFQELAFGNGQGDVTLIRDVLASEILEDQGLPAAQNAFYRVTLDFGDGPIYLGLYTAVEDPSDAMMDRVFGDDDGNLYKPEGDCANFTCFEEGSFEKKSNSDAADYSDVMTLQAALYADRSNAVVWRSGLEEVFDVDGFLHWLAVNSALENWDTYGALAHNYYLYADPGNEGRLTWIPWDHNLSMMDGMQGSSDPLLADVSDSWPLIRFLLDDPVYAATYQDYLGSSMAGAYDLDAFTARAGELSDLVFPELFGENGEIEGYTTLTSEEDYAASVEALVDHAQARQDTVRAALHSPNRLLR